METTTLSRSGLLHKIASNYVIKGLGEKDFDAIPYDDNISLRAPLCPGGSSQPLTGKENLRSIWWAPLPVLLKGVELMNTFVNKEEDAVAVEFYCHIKQPACTLRVIDRFKINDEGKITEQENFLDPRDVTNPGWK